MGSTGCWGHQEYPEATSAGGEAREHGAHRPWRTAASGARGAAATGRAREREVRGNDGKLTGGQQGGSVGSGMRQTSRIDGGELRWPATGTAMVAALQRVRDLVAR